MPSDTLGRPGEAGERQDGEGEPVPAQDEVAEFASLLRELKGRTDRSYGSLARRLHMNTSTLHRYCAGDAVPVDFAPVERFAALCGATDAERLELHRRWLRAAEARRRPRAGSETPRRTDASGAAGTPGGADTPGTAGASGGADAPHGVDTPEASDPPGEAGTRGATDTPGTADAPGEASGRPAAAGRGSEPDASPEGTAPHASPDGEGQHRTESGDAHPAGQAPPPDRPGTATRGDRPDRPGTAKRGDRPAGPARGEQPDGRRNDAAAEAGPAPAGGRADADDGHVVTGPAGHPTAPPSRRWRRKRVAVAAAAMCALLATVGSLSFLPDDRRTATGTGTVGAAEETDGSGSGDGAGPARSVAPSRSPSSKSPSPSPTPSARLGGNDDPSKAPRPSNSPTPPDPAPAGLPPLTWSVDSHAWAYGCGHDYVVAKPPAQVPPPPAPQDARTWAATQGAVHGGETLVELSVQGRSDTAVVLTALRVRVAGRSAPASGNAYAMDQGCGGALTPRYFDVDLDKDRPIARAVAGNDAGEPIPAVRMPYRVSATDPEVLMVTARTEGCDCRWYLELDWSSQGRTGTVRIDDRGRPFRTSAVEGLPHYEYDTLNRSWRTRTG
ncbi:helix-turn-helix domain-containing protein [Streptomyces sp. SudanB66_2053]|uniref:helix-turn-helix domain-containing protein n=1 Tax=Streptomyces sp. SudanB66_2053 TaxID=3035277 RepID=UPI003F574BA5